MTDEPTGTAPDAAAEEAVSVLSYDARYSLWRGCVQRWMQLVDSKVQPVEHEPELDSAPALSLTLSDGSVHTGAAAVAELGAQTRGAPVFRTLYRRVPGASFAANLLYSIAERFPSASSRLVRLTVGPDLRRPRHALTRWLFLRLLALTVLMATLSWWSQAAGLVGANGIAPAADYLERVANFAADQGWGTLERWRQVPTLLWLDASNTSIGLINALTVAGALLLLFNVLPLVGLGACWLGYLSLSATGGVFMGYQWDALLLETLFIAFFLAPRGLRPGLLLEHAPSWGGVWLVRLLVVKLMWMSAWAKLASGDPTWLDGSALDYHYWTQPLPAWTSYYAHHAWDWTRTAGTYFMFVAEILGPAMLFGPRRVRALGVWLMLALQLGIAMTGNYGYFNVLTCVILIACFDDHQLRALMPRRARQRVPDTHLAAYRRPTVGRRLVPAVLIGLVATLSLTAAWARVARPDPIPESLATLRSSVASLRVANSYGLFATMTTRRPEIVIEGSLDGVTWTTYDFPYKPTRLDQAPSFAQPHMPRLDWQLWFAALRGDCRRARWYQQFATRLLQGEPDVLALLDGNPFPDAPPRFLRSTLYDYAFTEPGSDAWWARSNPRPFCADLTLNNGRLVAAPGL